MLRPYINEGSMFDLLIKNSRIVNGKLVIDNSVHTGATPGRALRSQ